MHALLTACFVSGMQGMDRQTSKALLEFSYHLAIGDMNEAHKVSLSQVSHHFAPLFAASC